MLWVELLPPPLREFSHRSQLEQCPVQRSATLRRIESAASSTSRSPLLARLVAKSAAALPALLSQHGCSEHCDAHLSQRDCQLVSAHCAQACVFTAHACLAQKAARVSILTALLCAVASRTTDSRALAQHIGIERGRIWCAAVPVRNGALRSQGRGALQCRCAVVKWLQCAAISDIACSRTSSNFWKQNLVLVKRSTDVRTY